MLNIANYQLALAKSLCQQPNNNNSICRLPLRLKPVLLLLLLNTY